MQLHRTMEKGKSCEIVILDEHDLLESEEKKTSFNLKGQMIDILYIPDDELSDYMKEYLRPLIRGQVFTYKELSNF